MSKKGSTNGTPSGEPSDADWADLIDDDRITAARHRAEEQYRDLTSYQIEHFRRRAKNDLFFLCYGPLEYDLLSTKVHGHLAHWMAQTRDEQYRMMLLPRDHFKSTMITIGDSIQMALPNTAELASHPHCLGPNIKLMIGHEVRESASRFLYEITAAFTRKELMLALFPECIPTKRTQRINKWELELPRDEHHKEPTFDTIGAGGAAQGRHYNFLKLDDLVGEDARDSETVMKRVLMWFDNVNSLLSRIKFDGWDLIGTRWAFNDVYSHAMERYGIYLEKSVLNCVPQREIENFGGGRLCVYGRGALENGEPIFPEEFPLEHLKVLMKNRIVWAAQYANNPLESGLTEFQYPLKFYNVDVNDNLIVFSGEGPPTKIRPRELDICILSDPAVSEHGAADPSGVVVTGVDKRFNIYILETVKKHLKPPEFIDLIFSLHLKYRPRVISIEEVAFSAIYRYWISERAAQDGVFPNVRPYKPGTKKSKHARIRGLANFFASGQIYMAEGMYELREEIERFPLGDSEHLLDALAQGPEVWSPGLSAQELNDIERGKEIIQEQKDTRSALTGY